MRTLMNRETMLKAIAIRTGAELVLKPSTAYLYIDGIEVEVTAGTFRKEGVSSDRMQDWVMMQYEMLRGTEIETDTSDFDAFLSMSGLTLKGA